MSTERMSNENWKLFKKAHNFVNENLDKTNLFIIIVFHYIKNKKHTSLKIIIKCIIYTSETCYFCISFSCSL